MGTTGYRRAADLTYTDDEVILEIGTGESTEFLAGIGPRVVTIDIDPPGEQIPGVVYYTGDARVALIGWDRPIGFAWLDGWDFPYEGNPDWYYAIQRGRYAARGQEFTRDASRRSHLAVAQQIAGYARVVAFDDTWRTHAYSPAGTDRCQVLVPPATTPAPALAMDTPFPIHLPWCGLDKDHPHHNDPDRGWDGKGGEAIPWLLENGYQVLEYGLGLVVLEREDG